MLYNNLVSLKHNVSKAWANIDVLLKQRHDELPKLVETCKQYMGYEQETLEKVMQARAAVSAAREKGDVSALGPAETQLRMGLGNLFALAEAYPDLKANDSFQHTYREEFLDLKMPSLIGANFIMRASTIIMSVLNSSRMSSLPEILASVLKNCSNSVKGKPKTSM